MCLRAKRFGVRAIQHGIGHAGRLSPVSHLQHNPSHLHVQAQIHVF